LKFFEFPQKLLTSLINTAHTQVKQRLCTYLQNKDLNRVSFNIQIPNYQQSTLLHMVLDIAGQIIYSIPSFFVYQDRYDPNSDDKVEQSEIDSVRVHFKENPPIIKIANLGEHTYGFTKRVNDHAEITLNATIVQEQSSLIHHFRYLVLGVTTVIHELSHWKLRLQKERKSPSKFRVTGLHEVESGIWIEKKLSDGVIRPSNHKIGAGSNMLRIERYGIHYDGVQLVDDKFGEDLFECCMSGKQITKQIWQALLKQNLLPPKTDQHDEAWLLYMCKLGHDRYIESQNGASPTVTASSATTTTPTKLIPTSHTTRNAIGKCKHTCKDKTKCAHPCCKRQ